MRLLVLIGALTGTILGLAISLALVTIVILALKYVGVI